MLKYYILTGLLLISWGFACAPKPKTISMADGKYLQVTSQHEKAIKLFKDFLKSNPGSPYVPEAQYLIGDSYERLNQPELALKAYKNVLEKDPKSPYAALSYRQIAKQYAAKEEYQKAIENYQRALQVSNSSANVEDCTFAIAQVYQNGLKDYDAALREYRKLAGDLKNPRITVSVYLNMGKIFKQKGENDKARAAYQTIINKYSWSSHLLEAKKELEKLN